MIKKYILTFSLALISCIGMKSLDGLTMNEDVKVKNEVSQAKNKDASQAMLLEKMPSLMVGKNS